MLMKFLHVLLSAALLTFQLAPSLAWRNGIPQSTFANSQLNPNFLGGNESITINALKWAPNWTYNDLSSQAQPTDLNARGYPINGSTGFSHGGYDLLSIPTSSQFERAGNWVVIGSGLGTEQHFDGLGSSTSPGATGCSGTRSGSGNTVCNNSACTQPTGSISGTTLTITAASSCTLTLYQPISNGSTTVNQFGVPTIVIGNSTTNSNLCSPACTGAGGTGTYAVNWSQSVASTTFVQGLYNEIQSGTEITGASGLGSWQVNVSATDATNPLDYMALVHKSDLLAYAQGQLSGVLFKQRIQQGNFAVLRDLNTAHTNLTNVTTWATRKPAAYYSYVAPEQRSSIFQGTATYALNGSSNDYSINLGASLPVDKQTVCVSFPNTTTNSTITFSIDGGTTKLPMVSVHGQSLGASNIVANSFSGLTFDALLQKWFASNFTGTSNACLNNYMPPEAFVQINKEVGTAPWIVEPLFAADPLTDYVTQYALYVSGFSWNHTPIFEAPDETWNCSGEGTAPWLTAKAVGYEALDTAWGSDSTCGGAGNVNETGKIASLLGQAIRKVSNTLNVTVGVQTNITSYSGFNNVLLSAAYVNQNPSNIPTQSGCAGSGAVQTDCPAPFTQTAAYNAMKGATSAAASVTVANYWSTNDAQFSVNRGLEVGLAYCYFTQAAGCSSQASTMTTYMNTQWITNARSDGNPSVQTSWGSIHTFANTCAGGAGCSPMTVDNYEGTYSTSALSSDVTQSVTSATNASTAVLAVANNGCVAGQTVALSALSGGTWSTAAGSYTVQASGTDANHCAINLNSTGLGTLSSATLTYTSSANYVNYLRNNSWLSPDLATWTTTLYGILAGTSGPCAPSACSFYPSQFNFASTNGSSVGNWFTWSPDLYGYFQLASCSACTASGGTLNLGSGTVTGIFASGQTLIGGGISGATITGACSTSAGPLPAGANAGDTCPISNASTMTSHVLLGTIAPSNTCNPVTQWKSIGAWNQGSAC